MAAGLLGIWGTPGALLERCEVTALRDCWGVLGIWGEVLLDVELLGSCGGLENWDISRGLCWLFSPLQTTGPVWTVTGCWQHLPVSGLLDQRNGFGFARSGAVRSCDKELSAPTRAVPFPQLDREQDTQPNWFAHP